MSRSKYVANFILFVAGLSSAFVLFSIRPNKNIQPYVDSHLETVMEQQEAVLGIEYFGTPKVYFFQDMVRAGTYNSKNDEIGLSETTAITPEKSLPNIIRTCMAFGFTHSIKATLDHELGHFYVDKLSESIGKGDWPSQGEYRTVGESLVSEGIAEYFGRELNGGKDEFFDLCWPDNPEKAVWSLNLIYDGGYHLVKPIIDRYRKRGIEYLITHPPTHKDLGDLPGYQKRAMQELSLKPK